MSSPSVDTLVLSVVSVSGTTTPQTNAIKTTGNNELILVSMNSQYAGGSFLSVTGITGGGLTFFPIKQVYYSGVALGGVNGQFENGDWLTLEVWGAWSSSTIADLTRFTVTISANASVLLSAIAIENATSATGWSDPNSSLPASGANWQGNSTIAYATSFPDDLVLLYTGSAGLNASSPTGTTNVLNWAGAGSINISSISESSAVNSAAVMGDLVHTTRGSIGVILGITGDTGQVDSGNLSDSSTTAIANRFAADNEAGELGLFADTVDATASNNPAPFAVPPTVESHTPKLLVFDTTSKLTSMAGPNLEALIITPEIAPAAMLANPNNGIKADDRVRITSSKISIEGNYDPSTIPTLTLRYRLELEQATTDGSAVALNIWDECPQRTDTRYVRCLVDIPAGATWKHVDGVELSFGRSSRR